MICLLVLVLLVGILCVTWTREESFWSLPFAGGEVREGGYSLPFAGGYVYGPDYGGIADKEVEADSLMT